MAAYCIYYFYELFQAPYSGKFELNLAFWICTGLLFLLLRVSFIRIYSLLGKPLSIIISSL